MKEEYAIFGPWCIFAKRPPKNETAANFPRPTIKNPSAMKMIVIKEKLLSLITSGNVVESGHKFR